MISFDKEKRILIHTINIYSNLSPAELESKNQKRAALLQTFPSMIDRHLVAKNHIITSSKPLAEGTSLQKAKEQFLENILLFLSRCMKANT